MLQTFVSSIVRENFWKVLRVPTKSRKYSERVEAFLLATEDRLSQLYNRRFQDLEMKKRTAASNCGKLTVTAMFSIFGFKVKYKFCSLTLFVTLTPGPFA